MHNCIGELPKADYKAESAGRIYGIRNCAAHTNEDYTMSTRKKFSGFIDTVASAIAVSNAVREHRAPRSRDLVQLGIDPVRFREITRF